MEYVAKLQITQPKERITSTGTDFATADVGSNYLARTERSTSRRNWGESRLLIKGMEYQWMHEKTRSMLSFAFTSYAVIPEHGILGWRIRCRLDSRRRPLPVTFREGDRRRPLDADHTPLFIIHLSIRSSLKYIPRLLPDQMNVSESSVLIFCH